MRISRRTSGGRGEYEISENVGAVTPASLIDRRITLDFGGAFEVDTGTLLRNQGGKRRLRRDDETEIQIHRQIAAILLMPRPVRADDALGSSQPILKADRYAVEHIEITMARLVGNDKAVLSMGDITLRNVDLHAEIFSTEERVVQLLFLWSRSSEFPREIGEILEGHELQIRSGAPIGSSLEHVVTNLQDSVVAEAQSLGVLYGTGGDDAVLPLLAALATEPPAPPTRVEEVAQEETEIRRRTVRQWKRWAASRGAASARFSSQVRQAYRWTCVVCGVHLPATSYNQIAGVDGAHILSWSEFDLDVVPNGLCLCKQHHWAFDEALLKIKWNGEGYVIEVPLEAEMYILAECPRFDLESIKRFVGPIDLDRLPQRRDLWPNTAYLSKLYESEA